MKMCEDNLSLVVTVFPSGARDFLFVRPQEDKSYRAVHPLEILALDRTANMISRVGRKQAPLAVALALSRLLVPCLRYRGSGRHLVVELWSLADLQGESLPSHARTTFAKELSTEQAENFRAVTSGQMPPEGSLPELFWATQTDLPALAPVFEDPALSRLVKALYLHLVPEGHGMLEVDSAAIAAEIEACRANGFTSLNLGLPSRLVQSLFRKLLAVTVRFTSQLTGAVAEELIGKRLRATGRRKLTDGEREMLALRYGACRVLNDINVGFLFGCGPLLADLVNDYFLTLTGMRPEGDRAKAEELLRAFVYLLGGFERRRKLARAQERREDRQCNSDRMPTGPRHQAEFQPDRTVPSPEIDAATREEIRRLKDLLPMLKDRDAARLRAFIDCDGDRKAAAARLEIDPAAYSRQLRQTVFPAVRTLASKEGFELND
jgi:hypothetical protein